MKTFPSFSRQPIGLIGAGLVAAALLLSGGCGGSGSSSGTPPSSGQYQITDLGVLPGDTSSSAAALNSKGQVVGQSGNGSSSHAFLWQNGQLIDIGTLPGGSSSIATGINDNGAICGSSSSDVKDNQGFSVSHAFLYQSRTLIDLGTLPGDASSGAFAVSTDGTIVGSSFPPLIPSPNQTKPGPSHAVLFRNGSIIALGVLPPDTDSATSGINNSGQIVGHSFTPLTAIPHAFLYSNGNLIALGALTGDIGSSAAGINSKSEVVGFSEMDAGSGIQGREVLSRRAVLFANGHVTDLGLLPGDTDSQAAAINDKGQIVGVSQNNTATISTGVIHPFVWEEGRMVDLNSRLPASSGWILMQANSINNAGQICGTGLHNGQARAFLLTPQ